MAALTAQSCSVAGCPKPRHRRGYCGMHYARVRKYGGPGPAEPIGKWASLEDRFINHVQVNGPIPKHAPELGPCWQWTGSINTHGYGTIGINNKVIKVHRYQWQRTYGPIPHGKQIDHRCLNRSCVRPDHLRLTTQTQNLENHNGSAKRSSTSGVRDVFPTPYGRWVVKVGHDGTQQYFGTYATLEEAEQVAVAKRNELHTHNDVDRRV